MLSVVDLAGELVRINSVSPKTKTSTQNSGEIALAHWLTDYFQQNDFVVESQPVVGQRANLIARPRRFLSERPTLALEAHMDTVDVQGMTVSPFAAEIRDGAMWGRGSCDVKGTLAAMITAALQWHHREPVPDLTVMVLAAMGEEMGTLGSQALAKQQWPFRSVLVGEPTNLQPVVAHKGLWRLSVETFGKACHSSRPEEGVNAIESMFRMQEKIIHTLAPAFTDNGENTLSMTTLHSGSMINIIPDHACLEIDARFTADTEVEAHWQAWQSSLAGDAARLTELERKPAFSSRPDSLLLSALQSTAEKYGAVFQPRSERYYSDAGHFSAAGYDAIIWGAGDIRQAHTVDEHVPLRQLHLAVDWLLTLFEQYGRR
ncbi:M20 family metallopeptidase [bacterium]|nr:M20 family metallopeptidase [bacterium]